MPLSLEQSPFLIMAKISFFSANRSNMSFSSVFHESDLRIVAVTDAVNTPCENN
jgi:hypothetical protein